MSGDTNNLEQIEILNFLYKTSFRRPTTKDLQLKHPSTETFPFNDYSLGQEILLNRIKKFPIGDSFPTSSLLSAVDDSINIGGTNFGGKLGYPETTSSDSTSEFRVLNVIDSTEEQEYPNVNFILPPDFTLSSDISNFGNNYVYPELLSDGNRLAQLAPGGFVRDIKPNIRHFHRLILSPVDNLNLSTPIDLDNLALNRRTYAFAAFDRDGNNILKNSIPANIGGVSILSESPLKEVEYYAIYLGNLRYSIRQFSDLGMNATQTIASSNPNGNWTFDFKSGILLFNDIGTSSTFTGFPPVLSFFKYTGPVGLENLNNSSINIIGGGSSVNTNQPETMPFSKTDFLVSASSTENISLIEKLALISGQTKVVNITIFKKDTNPSTDGSYICKYTHSFINPDNMFSIEQEFNTSSDFTCNTHTSTGVLSIQNNLGSDLLLTILIKAVDLKGICSKTALNTTSLSIIPSGSNTIDVLNIIGIQNPGAILAGINIFKTGDENISNGGYITKIIHSAIKDQRLFSMDSPINNSTIFSASFDTTSGVLNITNSTTDTIELTALINYVDFFTYNSITSYMQLEKTLKPWKRLNIDLNIELNLSSGQSGLICIVIYNKYTDPDTSGGYLLKATYNTVAGTDLFTIRNEINKSIEFSADLNTDTGILTLSNGVNTNIDLKLKFSNLDVF